MLYNYILFGVEIVQIHFYITISVFFILNFKTKDLPLY